jgi:hypothetical protein
MDAPWLFGGFSLTDSSCGPVRQRIGKNNFQYNRKLQMPLSRIFPCARAIALTFAVGLAALSAQAQTQTPLPFMADQNLQLCLTQQAVSNGWQFVEQVTRLDCSSRGVVGIDGLDRLTSLTDLNLAGNQIYTVAPLLPLTGLTRVNLSGNGLKDANSLSQLSQLSDLDLSNNQLTFIAPLSQLRGLTRLNLSGNYAVQPNDLRPILDLNWGLTSLGLNGINVGGFASLSTFTNPQTGQRYNLTELDLGNTQIMDLTGGKSLDFLLPFQNLTRVNVAGNGITNINALSVLSKLSDVDLSNNQIATVAPLSQLHGLTRLILSGNAALHIADIRPMIDQNWGLTGLGLNGIDIGSIINLGGFFNPQTGQPYNMLELDLGNSKLTDPQGGKALVLPPFLNLTRLNVAGNGIDNISILSGFGKLTDLDLSNNQIADASPLFQLRGLTRMILSGNPIPNVQLVRPILDQNWGLTSIGLNGIEIGSVSNLGYLVNPQTGRLYGLTELDVGNSKLTDPQGGKSLMMPVFMNLTRLNVAGNGINDIAVLGAFSQLTALDLSHNQLLDIASLFPLRSLVSVNLLDNNGLKCVDLDNLASALPSAVIQRPLSCIPVNNPPVAGAGAAQVVNPGVTVTLVGSGTDSDGTVVSYAWQQIAGPAVVLAHPSNTTVTFVAPTVTASTTFTFRLTVTDDKGATAIASTTVTVTPPNPAPVVSAGSAQTVNERTSVYLNGSASPVNATITGYSWVQTAGPAVTLLNATRSAASFSAPDVAVDTVLTFKLTATDSKGTTGSASVNVTVKNLDGVDLAVTSVSSSGTTSVKRGATFIFYATTKNTGTLPINSTTTTGYYLSTDALITTADTLLGTVNIGAQAPGYSTAAGISVTVPVTLTPGTYYIGAIADYTNTLVEINKANNSFTGVTIQVTP